MPDRRPVVALDLMDTVLVDPFREALHAATGLTPRELFARRNPASYPAFERGELDEAAYWQAFRDAGIEFDAEAFHATRRAGYRWIDGMRELIDDLRRDGRVTVVTASNYPHWATELEHGLLAGVFDGFHVSYRLGARKPDEAFFARLVAEVDRAPEEVWFVDDREANVAGATAVGLHAHRFCDAETTRAWLRASAGLAV